MELLPTTTVIRCVRCSNLFVDRGTFDRHFLLLSPAQTVTGTLAGLPLTRACMTVDQRFAAGWSRDPSGLWYAEGGLQPAWDAVPRMAASAATPSLLT